MNIYVFVACILQLFMNTIRNSSKTDRSDILEKTGRFEVSESDIIQTLLIWSHLSFVRL